MRNLLVFTIALALMAHADTAGADERSGVLVVIVNASNAARPTASEIGDIYLRRTAQWGTGDRIVPLNAPPDSERRQQFDRIVLGMTPEEVARFWLDQRIRGRAAAPRDVADVHLAVRLVTKLPGAIAYVPADTELDGARVIARISNNKVVVP